MIRTRYRYDRVAWCYEWVAASYSLGAIPRAKASQVQALVPGQRVLYVGVGAGEDALLAARHEVELTCLDPSKAMLRRLARRLERHALDAELVECEILDHQASAPYDAVIANFVLNVFSEESMLDVMGHMVSLLVPGGRFLIADFAPPSSSLVQRSLYAAYYRPINLIAWALRLCELHPIYDYPRYFEALGLKLIERRSEPLWSNLVGSAGPCFYESLMAQSCPVDAQGAQNQTVAAT